MATEKTLVWKGPLRQYYPDGGSIPQSYYLYDLIFRYTITYDIPNNTSTLNGTFSLIHYGLEAWISSDMGNNLTQRGSFTYYLDGQKYTIRTPFADELGAYSLEGPNIENVINTVSHTFTHEDGAAINITFGNVFVGITASATITVIPPNHVSSDLGWLQGTDIYDVIIPAIPKEAELVTATNFTDEENPIITYVNEAGDNAYKLEACISLTGGNDDIAYRDIPKTGTSYTFELTEDERNVLRMAAINSQSVSVRFYLKTTFEDIVYWSYLTRTVTITNCNPVLNNPIVKDIKPETLALTGDENTIVRYESMVEYSFEPVARKYATIVNQYIQCGNKKVTGLSQGIIDDAESGLFIFGATDSRGLKSEYTIEKKLIEYVKPTCYQSFQTKIQGETGAQIILKIHGNYFNGSFGAADNTLKIEVKHTQLDGTMGDWVDLTDGLIPVFSGNTYELEITISGFSYDRGYTFQSRVTDKLNVVQSSQYTIQVLPVFDWGHNDFNFNVPVNINANELSMNGETVLRHSLETNNTVLSGSGGHIYLRPGGTNDTTGETIIYPDGSIKFGGEIDLSDTMSDCVIEHGTAVMGTNGTWYWAKWKSGKAECYGCRNFGNMAITTAWGGLYRSDFLTQSLPPELFSHTPEAIHIDLAEGSYGGWIVRHEETAPSSDSTGSFIVVRPASATITPSNISFNIVGRWD